MIENKFFSDFGSSPHSPGDLFAVDTEDEDEEKYASSESDEDDPSTVRSVSVTVHPPQGNCHSKRPRCDRAALSLALRRPTGGCSSSSPPLSSPSCSSSRQFSPAREAVHLLYIQVAFNPFFDHLFNLKHKCTKRKIRKWLLILIRQNDADTDPRYRYLLI